MNRMAVFNVVRTRRDIRGGVFNEDLLLVLSEQTPQITASTEAIVGRIFFGIVTPNCTFHCQWWLGYFRLSGPIASAVRRISRGSTIVAVHTHAAITVILIYRHSGLVDRDQVVVDAQAVTLCIAIGKEAGL